MIVTKINGLAKVLQFTLIFVIVKAIDKPCLSENYVYLDM